MSALQRCSSSGTSGTSSRLSENRKSQNTTSTRSVRSFASSSSAKYSFLSAYTATCAAHKTRPLSCVKVNSKAGSVEIWGDRMKVEDWLVVFEALSKDVSTHRLRIKSKRYAAALAKDYDTFASVLAAPKNVHVMSTAYVVREIAATVCKTLTHSTALVCLELENLLFDDPALDTLVSGIAANRTLQHLSLADCRVGDRTCLALCRVLRDKPNVRSVDLSGCSLSRAAVAGPGLADVIKKQQYKRHEECWAHSLRSRTANPDAMRGLRRLTLNDNPALGDHGFAELLEPLTDDLFVKAVDVQNCGLTDRSARLALATLAVNDTLLVLDVRKNALVSSRLLETVMAQLYENNSGRPDVQHWKWIKLGRDNAFDSSTTLTRSTTTTK